MSMGLLALLDDVAVFAKVAAASLDDVVGQATKAGSKAAAVVIDDAAVTPGYVVGFAAKRELPIIYKISIASLRNKLLILLPVAIALGYYAPWSLTPLLMIGGAYLCFEGTEKVYEKLFPHQSHVVLEEVLPIASTPEEKEKLTIAGAVRTDFILSAEITAIALSALDTKNLYSQTAILALIGLGLTMIVYGTVALIVKLDDMGLALAQNKISAPVFKNIFAKVGRGLVLLMPKILLHLTIVGTAAMTWVGGSIIAHGLDGLGVHLPESIIHRGALWTTEVSPEALKSTLTWVATSTLQGIFGLILGSLIIMILSLLKTAMRKKQ